MTLLDKLTTATASCFWCGGAVRQGRGRIGRRTFCSRTHKEAYFREALRIGLDTLDRADHRLEAAKRTSERNSAFGEAV